MNGFSLKKKIKDKFPNIYAYLGAYFRLIKFYHFCLKNKNFIYHIGYCGNLDRPINGNIGDPILYDRLEKVFDSCLGYENKWYHRSLGGEVSQIEVSLINKHSRAVIVGGGGLFLADSNKNDNSGWQFNIKICNLQRITVPLIFMAIGYNVFRGQSDFISVFKEHIKLCLEKAVFFGLRNYGSINALKKYLPENLHSKLKYQPCPTTMTDLFLSKTLNVMIKNEIVVCLAFDRLQNRFGDNSEKIFKQLIDFASCMKDYEIQVLFAVHMLGDMDVDHIQYFTKNGFSIVPLFQCSEDEVY
jgi:hypothetical protein